MEEQKFDKNSIIGFLLIGMIMLYYLYTNQPEITPEEINEIRKNKNMIFSIKTSTRADYQDYVALLDEFKKAKAKKISIAKNNQEGIDASDWIFIGGLPKVGEKILSKLSFKKKQTVISFMSTTNYLKLKKEQKKSDLPNKIGQSDFENENLNVKFKDYYFSNVIARSSKTMVECNNSKIDLKKTGTEG